MNIKAMPSPFELDPVTGFAVPVFFVLLVLEFAVLQLQRRQTYPRADALASLAMGIGSAPINVVMKTVAFLVFSALYQLRLFDLPMGAAWVWVLLVFADDLAFYMHHRACHSVRLFWAGHVNHHSSTHYNFAVALRQSWGELTHKYIWWLWLPLVGFHPLMILMMMAFSLIFQFFLHTTLVGRMGILEAVLNTPSHHRVHHASNIRYLDRNHAGIFIIWDRLFGTFEPERDDEPVVYGLTSNIRTVNPLRIASHEYASLFRDVRNAPTFGAKLRYLFKPPGWSHDGSTKTAGELQREFKASERTTSALRSA